MDEPENTKKNILTRLIKKKNNVYDRMKLKESSELADETCRGRVEIGREMGRELFGFWCI